MSNPHVTVLIAHHNYQRFLKKAILSGLNQDYKNISIYVVDDKSEDQRSVKEICDECFGEGYLKSESSSYKRIAYHGTKNGLLLLNNNEGPSTARNMGILDNIKNPITSTNHSDFFMILDADDEMMPNKVSELLKPMLMWDSVGVSYGDYLIKNEQGLIRKEHKKSYSLDLLTRECIVHSGSLIRTEALLDVENEYSFYDHRFRVCEDYQLWLRISQKYMIYHVPKILTLVNDHSDNSTNSVDKETWIKHWKMLNSSIKG